MPPPPPESDAAFMRRAIRLAMNGRGRVEPNPTVGCVIVKDGRIIGEGFHQQFGGAHAEPNALAACSESPAGATAYVTLEPCCHANKKTPPCAPRLIEARLGRVVVGCLDPNEPVNGKGAQMLRAAGISVDGPVLEAEAKELIAPFIHRLKSGPYRTIKWAESADGKVAGPGGRRTQITNPAATRIVHELRARCDAIAVGINTVLHDDPMLTARGVPHARPIRRFVLDTHLRIPLNSTLVQTANEVKTIVLSGPNARPEQQEILANLRAAGVEVILGLNFNEEFYRALSRADPPITHVLIEAGPTMAKAFLPDAHRLWVFRSPNPMNDDTAPAAPPIPPGYISTGSIDMEGDQLTEYLNPAGGAFFAPVPSADLVLAAESALSH